MNKILLKNVFMFISSSVHKVLSVHHNCYNDHKMHKLYLVKVILNYSFINFKIVNLLYYFCYLNSAIVILYSAIVM